MLVVIPSNTCATFRKRLEKATTCRMSHRKCTCAWVRPRHQVCGSAPMYPQNITSSSSLNPSWTWWAWWSPGAENNVHASAFPWLSEACEWLQSVTELRNQTLTAPVAKWSKESVTAPGQKRNSECAPRWLVKCDNVFAGHRDLSGWIKDDGGQMSSTELHLALGWLR